MPLIAQARNVKKCSASSMLSKSMSSLELSMSVLWLSYLAWLGVPPSPVPSPFLIELISASEQASLPASSPERSSERWDRLLFSKSGRPYVLLTLSDIFNDACCSRSGVSKSCRSLRKGVGLPRVRQAGSEKGRPSAKTPTKEAKGEGQFLVEAVSSMGAGEVEETLSHLESRSILRLLRVFQNLESSTPNHLTLSAAVHTVLLKTETYCALEDIPKWFTAKVIFLRQSSYHKTLSALFEHNIHYEMKK